MKRLLAFLFLTSFIFVLPMSGECKLFDNANITSAVFVCKDRLDDLQFVQSSEQYYYKATENFSTFYKNFKNIDGITLYFDNYNLQSLISDYKISYFKGGDVENYKIYYGYTNLYPQSFYMNNKKINVQIAVQGNQIIVGFPAILNGF